MEHGAVQPSEAGSNLPRVIHQTWKHRHVRWPLSHCMASFRKWNPGWECRLWTDEEAVELIASELPDFLSTYLAFAPGILRADIFRIAVLYLRGGVYADLDMECLRPLEELLAAAGDDAWEVLLARDHPSHEKLHYKGRAMWLNAIMLAKPKSLYFARVLTELDQMAAESRLKGDAVSLTGPGLLTNVIEKHEGDLESLAIRSVPWEWLHPLPNVFVRFPERPMYRRLIRTREWRDGKQVDMDSGEGGWRRAERPFAAHYWWHSYIGECRDKNMLERYASSLLQSDGDIAETRLQATIPGDPSIPESAATALTMFAEQGCGTILQLGDASTALPRSSLECMAERALQGWEWQLETAPGSAEGIHRIGELRPGLVIAGQHLDGHLAEVAAAIRERTDSLLLLPAAMAAAEPLKSTIEAGAWEVLASDALCLLRATQAKKPAIPEVLHLPVCSLAERRSWRLAGIHSRLQSWHLPFQQAGWKTRLWKKEDLADLIGSRAPEVLDALWPIDDFAAFWQAARLFIAAWEGGLMANPGLLCLRSFADHLRESRLMLSTHQQNETIHANDLVIASEAGHPFWNGLETDALRWLGANPGKPLGSQFLEARARDAARFLKKEDWPALAEPEWFGLSLGEMGSRNSPWRVHPAMSLEALFPGAFAIKF